MYPDVYSLDVLKKIGVVVLLCISFSIYMYVYKITFVFKVDDDDTLSSCVHSFVRSFVVCVLI